MIKNVGICSDHKSNFVFTNVWLLSKSIEFIKNNRSKKYDEFMRQYPLWADNAMSGSGNDRFHLSSPNDIEYHSIGEMIRQSAISMSGELQKIYEVNNHRFGGYINIKTLDVCSEFATGNISIYNADQIAQKVKENPNGLDDVPEQECWMKSDDFYIYYAHYMMKTYFGSNVWVNMRKSWDWMEDHRTIHIYWDVKTDCELKYVRSKSNNIIIELRMIDGSGEDVSSGYRRLENKYSDFIWGVYKDCNNPLNIPIMFSLAKNIVEQNGN